MYCAVANDCIARCSDAPLLPFPFREGAGGRLDYPLTAPAVMPETYCSTKKE